MATTKQPAVSGLPLDDIVPPSSQALPPDLKTLADTANEAAKGTAAL